MPRRQLSRRLTFEYFQNQAIPSEDFHHHEERFPFFPNLERHLQGGPPPIAPEIFIIVAAIGALSPGIRTYETPVAIRFTSYFDSLWWNCVASYSANYKDAITHERPEVVAPDSDMHVTSLRADCAVQATATYAALSIPGAFQPFAEAMEAMGKTVEPTLDPQVEACGKDYDCLNSLAAENDYDAVTMGHIVAKLAYDFSLEDGFNQLGNEDGCSVNCRAYRDTTGYEPVDSSLSSKKTSKKSSKKRKMRSKSSFKTSSMNCKWGRWRPLLEDNGKGFFYFQEHVVPHIGSKAKLRNLPEAERKLRVARRPRYSPNRRRETAMVIERMSQLDDLKKIQVEVFDDKITVIDAVINSFVGKKVLNEGYVDKELGQPGLILSFERLLHFVRGATSSEWDSTIIAWKEKVSYDLIRPTSVIKELGDALITTWAPGGVRKFPAKDFEAYIRVMPHSEYVSGSACLFQALEEYVVGYMEMIGLDPTFPVVFGEIPAGGSKVEPGKVPSAPMTLTYPDIETMAAAGSESRLDGGMHFGESVPAGKELCKGIGPYSLGADLIGFRNNLVDRINFIAAGGTVLPVLSTGDGRYFPLKCHLASFAPCDDFGLVF
eukprot:scaffold768_cov166-Amphora_coffeaeformis.AAC.9